MPVEATASRLRPPVAFQNTNKAWFSLLPSLPPPRSVQPPGEAGVRMACRRFAPELPVRTAGGKTCFPSGRPLHVGGRHPGRLRISSPVPQTPAGKAASSGGKDKAPSLRSAGIGFPPGWRPSPPGARPAFFSPYERRFGESSTRGSRDIICVELRDSRRKHAMSVQRTEITCRLLGLGISPRWYLRVPVCTGRGEEGGRRVDTESKPSPYKLRVG